MDVSNVLDEPAISGIQTQEFLLVGKAAALTWPNCRWYRHLDTTSGRTAMSIPNIRRFKSFEDSRFWARLNSGFAKNA
jgi:hypothetical protein